MSSGWGDGERSGRFAGLLALGGAATAIISAFLARSQGEPYLSAEGVNAWVVVFAAGLMAALLAFPFGLEVKLRDRFEDRDKRWEASLLAWGCLALLLFAAGFLAGFDTASLGGALGTILVIESALVAGTVLVWLLAGG